MSKDNMDEATKYLIESTKRVGASAVTVKDGHIFMFKRSFMKDLLEKNSDKEEIIIFLKRPELN